ncbi:hypothetical protein J4414_01920 [Candidatus Woesearchaeota archaeon]|nr:hypothetical protein [Candidatus Woesearchaeota archaeon]
MEDFNGKAEIKNGRNSIVCSLRIKNNIIYNIHFNLKNKDAEEIIKLVKNKVLTDVEKIQQDDLYFKAVKEAIKNYKENYRDPLLKITNIIKDYDSGFPERKVEDEYETCSHVH